MMHYRRLIMALFIVAICTLVGCVSSQKPATSGFLKSYPTFTKGPDGVDQRYLKPGVDFSKYNKIMMDEVVFFFNTDADYKGIHPSEIKELSDTFHSVFVKIFGDRLTDTPGPNVARMRLAVTDIEPSNPVTSSATTVVPVGLAFSLVKRGATGEYAGIGSASAEVEFLDSLTNERIAAGIDKHPGAKLDISKLSPIKAAFEYWAHRLDAFMKNSKTK